MENKWKALRTTGNASEIWDNQNRFHKKKTSKC